MSKGREVSQNMAYWGMMVSVESENHSENPGL